MGNQHTSSSDLFECCFCVKSRSTSDACLEGDLGYVKGVLKSRDQAIKKDSDGKIPVFAAVKSGSVPTVRYLLGVGAHPTIVTKNRWSLLHEAVCTGSMEMVRYIIERGTVPTYMMTTEGISPLHLAVFNGQQEILKILLENTNPSRVSPRGKSGTTPLMMATKSGDKEMMRDLYHSGASFFEEDDNGKNSVLFARGSNVLDVVYDLNICVKNDVSGLPMSAAIMIDNIQWRRNMRKKRFFGIK